MGYRAKDGRIYPHKETPEEYRSRRMRADAGDSGSNVEPKIWTFLGGALCWAFFYSIFGAGIWILLVIAIVGYGLFSGTPTAAGSISGNTMAMLVMGFFLFWVLLFIWNLFMAMLPFLIVGGLVVVGLYIWLKLFASRPVDDDGG